MVRFFKHFKDKKVRFFLGAFTVALVIVFCIFFITKTLTKDNFPDIAVEFHGMVFDIILFGLILTIYENILDRKKEKKRYEEEIEDFREWKEDEAKYRILGNIKRLAKMEVTEIDLNNCYLEGVALQELKFSKSNFLSAMMKNAQIMECEFQQSVFVNTNLNNSVILKSHFFYRTNLTDAKLENTIIAHCNFKGATFGAANFEGAKFFDLNFSGVDLSKVNLKGVKWDKTSFPHGFDPEKRGMIKVDSLYEVLLADDRIKIIQNKYNSPFIKKEGYVHKL